MSRASRQFSILIGQPVDNLVESSKSVGTGVPSPARKSWIGARPIVAKKCKERRKRLPSRWQDIQALELQMSIMAHASRRQESSDREEGGLTLWPNLGAAGRLE